MKRQIFLFFFLSFLITKFSFLVTYTTFQKVELQRRNINCQVTLVKSINLEIKRKKKMVSDKDFHTFNEIISQPDLWEKISELFSNHEKAVSKFLSRILHKQNLNIVLTGAGSSAFIGEVIESSFKRNFDIPTRAISTTSLVTHFTDFISFKDPLLLISFARSGNSPESNAVIDLAQSFCKDVHHIVITCNENGALSQKIDSLKNGLKITLPDNAEDRGLAMTGSFTGMILTGLLISQIKNFRESSKIVTAVSNIAETIINNYLKDFKEIASFDFDRIVFLGSGPLLSIARESHLKVQELTDGIVIGKFDSFLGFRHGPKAVINNRTIIVYLFSSDPYVFKYEKDLANEISNHEVNTFSVGIFSNGAQSKSIKCNLKVVQSTPTDTVSNDLYFLPYVIPSQLIGLYKSIQLGLNPDTPSRNGAISRVVKGVKIYNHNNQSSRFIS